MIRLSGVGEAIRGGTPGDLYVKIHVETHPVFRKDGANLVMDLEVKLTDALFGASYTVAGLDGELAIAVPAGTTFGDILRFKGKGIPTSRGRGDLLVRVRTKIPKHLSRSAQKLVEELKKEGI